MTSADLDGDGDSDLAVANYNGDSVSVLLNVTPPDSTPPETTIDSGAAEGATVGDRNPAFTFSSSEPGSTFECRVDGGAFSAGDRPAGQPSPHLPRAGERQRGQHRPHPGDARVRGRHEASLEAQALDPLQGRPQAPPKRLQGPDALEGAQVREARPSEVFKRKVGKDKRVGADRTNRRRRYKVRERRVRGCYYAKVNRDASSQAVCAGTQSKVKRFR